MLLSQKRAQKAIRSQTLNRDYCVPVSAKISLNRHACPRNSALVKPHFWKQILLLGPLLKRQGKRCRPVDKNPTLKTKPDHQLTEHTRDTRHSLFYLDHPLKEMGIKVMSQDTMTKCLKSIDMGHFQPQGHPCLNLHFLKV